jgi:putative PIN family toxin of toxin-antitoxin system
MKVVIDTNVIISGVFFSGPPFQILKSWKDGLINLVVSPEILEEYKKVGAILANDHPGINFEPFLAFLIQNAIFVSAPALSDGVCDDPDDDKFFACALAGGCDLIVSGDKHLLAKSGYRKVEVLRPRAFIDKYLFL